MARMRLRYLALISMFSSMDSSDRSSMWLLNSGSPCLAKYSSLASR
jgi:hypothetical protein